MVKSNASMEVVGNVKDSAVLKNLKVRLQRELEAGKKQLKSVVKEGHYGEALEIKAGNNTVDFVLNTLIPEIEEETKV
jgi:hypothetical protein